VLIANSVIMMLSFTDVRGILLSGKNCNFAVVYLRDDSPSGCYKYVARAVSEYVEIVANQQNVLAH